MQLEQQEDQAQFKLKNASASIKERRRRGLTWYPVTITQEDIGFGGKVMLELERPAHRQDLHLFQVGAAAALFSGAPGYSGPDRPVVSGVMTRVRRNKLLLATTKEALPDWVLNGSNLNGSTLGVDLTFDEVSYREMNQALSAVMAAHGNRLAELRDVLLGTRQATFREPQSDDLFYPSALNDSQLAAVRHVVTAQDVAIIHGPPGTGKTTTLVQAILETIRRERRVLVCAPSNTAVDLLTEKLAERGVNVIRLGNPSRVSDLLLKHTLDAGVMAHASYAKMHAMRQTAEQHRETASERVRNFGFEERQRRQWLKDEARTLRQAADDLERFMTEDVLESVQVITCTLVGASNRAIRNLGFETVFIDEAAQALEPGCWIPIAKGQRLVLAGDHHQLPPTVKSEKAAREGLRETLFEKCIQRQPGTARMLKVQYRMHAHIMGFSSEKFYGGQLVAHPSVRDADLAAYDPRFNSPRFNDPRFNDPRFSPDLPVEFIDTAGCGFQELAIPESRSTANPEEAHLLLERLAQLLAQLSEPGEPTDPDQRPLTIGVIAPYRAQINYLKDAIEDSAVLNDLLLQRRLSVGTVDSFQGQERDIIAITLTRSNPQGEIGFLSDIRRMNVGMTRARRKLLLVGDSSTLCRHPFFGELLAYVKGVGGYRTAHVVGKQG
jgi:ATP-dependent RNA/DNA helicase IGHMBP2